MADGTKYIGIVERNTWERETFGYYFELTDETQEALEGIMGRYRACGCCPELSLVVCTGADLEILEKNDRNGYMRRVNIYRAPEDWAKWEEEHAADPIEESHPFYKGRGLVALKG